MAPSGLYAKLCHTFLVYCILHNGGTSTEYVTIQSDYSSGYRNKEQ